MHKQDDAPFPTKVSQTTITFFMSSLAFMKVFHPTQHQININYFRFAFKKFNSLIQLELILLNSLKKVLIVPQVLSIILMITSILINNACV